MRYCSFLALGGIAFLTLPGRGAELADPRKPIAPFSATALFARQRRMALSGIEAAPAGAAPRPGDEVTLLLTRYVGNDGEQWIVRLRRGELTATERLAKPPPEDVNYSGSGRTLRYGYTPAALALFLAGPFKAGPAAAPARVKEDRVVVNDQYLRFGLDQFCLTYVSLRSRIKACGLKDPWFGWQTTGPYGAERLARGRRTADAVRLTEEEDRLAGGAWYPLGAFVDAATQIPECEEVLLQVMAFPSPWSIVTHLGVDTSWSFSGFKADEGVLPPAGLPLRRFDLKMKLNGRDAAAAAVAAAEPRPPLDACAGIVGLYAERPNDPARRLFIQLVASRRGQSFPP